MKTLAKFAVRTSAATNRIRVGGDDRLRRHPAATAELSHRPGQDDADRLLAVAADRVPRWRGIRRDPLTQKHLSAPGFVDPTVPRLGDAAEVRERLRRRCDRGTTRK